MDPNKRFLPSWVLPNVIGIAVGLVLSCFVIWPIQDGIGFFENAEESDIGKIIIIILVLGSLVASVSISFKIKNRNNK